MFHAGGISYVYLIYGMYCCFNVVAGPEGEGQAVLIRAIEPICGTDSWPHGGRPGKPAGT